MPSFDLSGSVALVTGANTGLGQGMAIALAQAGADIVLVGRSAPNETLKVLQDLGRKAYDVRADLSDISSVTDIMSSALNEAGRIDILVNNAGIIRRNDALDFSELDWDDVMNVNLKSVFFLSQGFAKHCIEQSKPGKIVNIASMLSYQGGIRVVSYTSSKSGVMGLTRILANEWAGHNINVNAIAPGYFDTNNTKPLQADPKRNAEILGRIPAKRWGHPSDLGGAAVFLASSAANYINGITLPVDGGWLSR